MIRYQLKCAEGHAFEAWFGSAAAYDEQVERGLVGCAICGSVKVEKALMTPQVPARGNAREEGSAPMLAGPVPAAVTEKLAALRREIEKNSSYVGRNFAAEARAMHVGDAERRAIHGEATGEEARTLIEEGIPIAPLPPMPRRDD